MLLELKDFKLLNHYLSLSELSNALVMSGTRISLDAIALIMQTFYEEVLGKTTAE